MTYIDPDAISIPSSLKVHPTQTWYAGDSSLPGEADHLRTRKCPVCQGWSTTEEYTVWRPAQGAVRRTVVRCQSGGDRSIPKCAPQVVKEEPITDDIPSP